MPVTTRATAAVAAAALTLTACGGGAPTPQQSLPTPTAITIDPAHPSSQPGTPSTPAGTPGSRPPETNVATLEEGNGSAMPLVLPSTALPGGWAETQPREARGYRMLVCGVDLEPGTPIDATQKRWQRTGSGPFLEQHVRVYKDATSGQVVSALRKALPGCRTYPSGGSAPYRVERLTVPGATASTVAWRQRLTLTPATPAPTATASPAPPAPATPTTSAAPPPGSPELVQDITASKVGSSIVLFISYQVGGTPPADVLPAALKGQPHLR